MITKFAFVRKLYLDLIKRYLFKLHFYVITGSSFKMQTMTGQLTAEPIL